VKEGRGSGYELVATVGLTYEPSDNSALEKDEGAGLSVGSVETTLVS
jgi:hypothetical protein